MARGGRSAEDREDQPELALDLVLPLLDQIARADEATPLQVATQRQFFDERVSRDRIARPNHQRGVNRQHRIA